MPSSWNSYLAGGGLLGVAAAGLLVADAHSGSAQIDHGNASLHCQHFPSDCAGDGVADAEEAAPDGSGVMPSGHAETGMDMTATGPATEAGQGAFAALSEINGILEEGEYDWESVDMDALWEHLRSMNALMMLTEVAKTDIEDGLRMEISGEGAAKRAMDEMIPAHANFLRGVRPDWKIDYEQNGEGWTLVVTSADEVQAQKIRGLGFSGFMVQDDHHASHHFLIATGEQAH